MQCPFSKDAEAEKNGSTIRKTLEWSKVFLWHSRKCVLCDNNRYRRVDQSNEFYEFVGLYRHWTLGNIEQVLGDLIMPPGHTPMRIKTTFARRDWRVKYFNHTNCNRRRQCCKPTEDSFWNGICTFHKLFRSHLSLRRTGLAEEEYCSGHSEDSKAHSTHFHFSPLQSNQLMNEAAKYDEISYRKLEQECPSSWGCIYDMLSRLLAMKILWSTSWWKLK